LGNPKVTPEIEEWRLPLGTVGKFIRPFPKIYNMGEKNRYYTIKKGVDNR